MKIVQVVSSIEEQAAGPTYSVMSTCEALARGGADVALHVLGKSNAQVVQRGYRLEAHTAWPIPKALGISPMMYGGLRRECEQADIIHNNLLWMMPNYYAGRLARGAKARLVTSPRGTLASWAWQRSRWKKAVFWHLGQKDVLHNAACLHATSEGECQDIRRMGFRTPVALIPNGIDIPERMDRAPLYGRRKRLLFLGRIHPVKGIDLLLRAWSSIERRYPDWELAIYGPDNDGYLGHMKRLSEELRVERAGFFGAVFGRDKDRVYSASDVYVLPTHTENFGLTIAEALAHELPCIVTKGAPWSGLEDRACGWWIERSEGSLRNALMEAMDSPDNELRAMGRRGRQWMMDAFSWTEAGEKMLQTYRWLLGGGAPPDWICTSGRVGASATSRRLPSTTRGQQSNSQPP